MVTALLFLFGFPFFFVFLFIPLIPFFGREKRVKRCPECGFATTDDRVKYCPYDGSALEVSEGNQ
jgi:hypothetical protein